MAVVQKRMRKYFSGNDGKLMDVMRDDHPIEDLYATINAKHNLFKTVLPDENYLFSGDKINFGGHKGIH